VITYGGAGAAAASFAKLLVRPGHPDVEVYDGRSPRGRQRDRGDHLSEGDAQPPALPVDPTAVADDQHDEEHRED
jgi:hypothetical protein